MINKLNASARLYLLVFVMSVFIIGIGVYGIREMKKMSQNTQTLYADRVLCLRQLTTIRFSYAVGILSSAEQAQAAQLSFKEAAKQIEEAEKTITTNWKAYMITYLTPEEAQLADQASSLMDQSITPIEKLTETLNKEDAHALDNIINKELYPAVNPVITRISALVDLQVSVGAEVYKRNTELYNIALKKFILLILLSLAFAIPFSYYLVRSVNYLIKGLRTSNEKVAESEEKFRSLVEHAGDAFFMVAEDTSIIDVNRSACEMLGYSRQELQSMKALDVYPPDELGTPPIDWDSLRKNKTLLNERRLQRKDGTKVEVEVSRKMLADGKEYLAIVRDITERKKAEEEQVLSKFIINSSDDAVISTDLEGNIISWNRGAETIYGYPAKEAMSKHISIIIPPEYLNEEQVIMEKITRGEHTEHCETIRLKKNKEQVHVSLTVSPIRNANGNIIGSSKIARDITERKAMESELKQLNLELEQKVQARTQMLQEALTALENSKEELSEALKSEKGLNELKSRFVTMASHEFRTPLSTILSSTFLLENYNASGEIEKRAKHLNYIRTAVTDMKSTLEDFLSLGKLEEGLIKPHMEIIPPDELSAEIQNIIEEMEHHCKDGQQIIFQQQHALPAYLDKKFFRNILHNLLSNAIKYSPEGSMINVNSIINKDQLLVSVEDKGIGIPEEDLEHLSDRFFRAKNAANIQGTGLGLHIVSRYLNLMNGHMEIRSTLNQGTIFSFYIPSK